MLSTAQRESTIHPTAPGSPSPVGFGCFLLVALIVLFPKVVFGLTTFYHRDYGVLAYPTIYYQHTAFWRGELPLWNPYSNCGVPFLAQWGTMGLYPFSLFYLLLPLPWSLNCFCLAHLFWGGLGMFYLAQGWTRDRFAAAFAGTLFLFNGVTLSCLMWPNYVVALGWMPWVIWTVDLALPRPNRQWLILAAFAGALQMLSGVPEIVLLTWLLLLGLVLERAVSARGARMALLKRALLLIALVAALVAVQLLPFFDLLAHSQRTSAAATSKWAMPLWAWGNFLLPMFRCAQSYQGVFFQLGEDFFASTYLGLATVALALIALWKVRQPRIWLLASLVLLCLLFAAGEKGSLYRAARALLPQLGLARYPIKFVLLPAFALPLLAGYGTQALRAAKMTALPKIGRETAVVGALLVVGVLGLLWLTKKYPTSFDQWPVVWKSSVWHLSILIVTLVLASIIPSDIGSRRTAILVYLALALLMVDACVAVPQKNMTLPATVMAPGLWEMQNQLPPPRLGEGRAWISPEAEEYLLTSHVREPEADFVGKRLALWSNLNLLEGVAKVNGSSTLQIQAEKQIETILYASTNQEAKGLIRFLGVTFGTTPGKIVEWSKQSNSLPLLTIGQFPIFASPESTITALTRSDFDSRIAVYLPEEARELVHAAGHGKSTILSSHFSPQSVTCIVKTEEAALIVVAQTFYAAWHAYVDGKRTVLWRANYAFQGVEVPAGQHQVELRYEDRWLEVGALISLITLAGCVSTFCASAARRVSDVP